MTVLDIYKYTTSWDRIYYGSILMCMAPQHNNALHDFIDYDSLNNFERSAI